VFEHPLWTALDPYFMPHVPEVNALLLKMHGDVTRSFFQDHNAEGNMPLRDWFVMEDESLWDYPYLEAALMLDLLATFLLLFRESKEAGRPEIAVAFGKRVRAQLHDARACMELRRFQPELLKYVLENFLGPGYLHVDRSVPYAVADDFAYTPPARVIYRYRGRLV
jgi:hypothetical protein